MHQKERMPRIIIVKIIPMFATDEQLDQRLRDVFKRQFLDEVAIDRAALVRMETGIQQKISLSLRRRWMMTVSVFIVSCISCIVSSVLLIVHLVQSDSWGFVQAATSDAATFTLAGREWLLSMLESFPVFDLICVMSLLALCLWLIQKIAQFPARSFSLPLFDHLS